MKYVEQFFQMLSKGLTGKNKIVFIAVAVIILGVSQYVYLKYFVYTSPSDINKIISRLGPPNTPLTEKTQEKLRKLGPRVIDELAAFCSRVEDPVQMDCALQRASAVEVLSSFYKNPQAISTLIRCAGSEDGIVRKKAVHDLRYQWGDGVIETLIETIRAGDIELTVMKKGTPFIYTDFDLTAVDSLKTMYDLWRGKNMKAAEKIRSALEKALEYPRVSDKARKALGR